MGSNLKAFIRYTSAGKVIPGSLILRKKMPYGRQWKEVDADLCCNPPTTTTTTTTTTTPIP